MTVLPDSLTEMRSYTFHLTPWAPGCNGRTVGSADRNRMMAAEPVRAMRSLLKRLMIAPENVRAQVDSAGDPEIVRIVDDAPLCLIWHGLDVAEANVLISHLALTGWRPEATRPLPRPCAPESESLAA